MTTIAQGWWRDLTATARARVIPVGCVRDPNPKDVKSSTYISHRVFFLAVRTSASLLTKALIFRRRFIHLEMDLKVSILTR